MSIESWNLWWYNRHSDLLILYWAAKLITGRYNHWAQASPWLSCSNPRDIIMPKDGDDGYFPTTGNDLVSYNLLIWLHSWGIISPNCKFNFFQKPEVVASSRKYRVRVLVCAPSNSALDEIVLRLLRTGTSFLHALIFASSLFLLNLIIMWYNAHWNSIFYT